MLACRCWDLSSRDTHTLTLSLVCEARGRPAAARELVADFEGAVLCRSRPCIWDWC
jgi:hypothetical protein